jgi:adenine phosphoribosyltransferase
MDYKNLIRDIPDFPKKGILFRDLTTLWKDAAAFRTSLEDLAKSFQGEKIDKVVGVESRGFIVATGIALILKCGFVPVRKKGKLPGETISASYELEYGTDTLYMHKGAIEPGERILIADDLIATGGTCKAAADLSEQLGGTIAGFAFLVELEFLKGRDKIRDRGRIVSLVTY